MLVEAVIILSTTTYSGKTFEDIWEILYDNAKESENLTSGNN